LSASVAAAAAASSGQAGCLLETNECPVPTALAREPNPAFFLAVCL
jgi:hypothetical protein